MHDRERDPARIRNPLEGSSGGVVIEIEMTIRLWRGPQFGERIDRNHLDLRSLLQQSLKRKNRLVRIAGPLIEEDHSAPVHGQTGCLAGGLDLVEAHLKSSLVIF